MEKFGQEMWEKGQSDRKLSPLSKKKNQQWLLRSKLYAVFLTLLREMVLTVDTHDTFLKHNKLQLLAVKISGEKFQNDSESKRSILWD